MKQFDKDFSKVRNKVEGMSGEALAQSFLMKKKYSILEVNYRVKFGEIDIIAKDGKTIVFVEVKKRQTLQFGRPIEAVDNRKVQIIKKVAEVYLMMKHIPYADVRFDVIEIVGDQINHVENAFC